MAAGRQPYHRHRADRPAAGAARPPAAPGALSALRLLLALAQSTGYFAFLVAADSSGISVPAVLASQASVVGMVIAFLVLGERLSYRQLAGIAALLTGVALVAATR